jgi:membrane-associated phospholipid phosphatase
MPRLILCLSLLFSGLAYAESPADNETFGQMMWRDFSSPVTTRAWIPLVAGSGLTGLAYATRGDIQEPLQRNWSVNKPLGDASKVGDIMGQVVPNAIYFLAMYGDYYWGTQNKKSRQRALLMFKATAYSGGWAIAIKSLYHEPRPNNSTSDSFPSGHATTAFAFAAVVGAEHKWYWGVPAYALATFVGASRINDNMHQLHDVIAGATIGMSYGLGLYYRLHAGEDGRLPTSVYQVLPTDRMDGALLTYTREF